MTVAARQPTAGPQPTRPARETRRNPKLPNPFDLNRRIMASDLPTTAKLLTIKILDRGDYGVGDCYASDEWLGRGLGRNGGDLSARQVYNLRRLIDEHGWTETERTGPSKFSYKRIRPGPQCFVLSAREFPGKPAAAPVHPEMHLEIPCNAPGNPLPAIVFPSSEGNEKTTTPRAREAAAAPESSPSSFASLSGGGTQTSEAPVIANGLDALVERLMILLAIVKTMAAAKVREWVTRHGLEKAELVISLGESLKAKGKAVNEALLGWHLTRWNKFVMPLEAIRKEVADARPQAKPPTGPAQAPPGTPAEQARNQAAGLLEEFRANDCDFVIQADGSLKPVKLRHDARWNGELAGRLMNVFGEPLRELLERERGAT